MKAKAVRVAKTFWRIPDPSKAARNADHLQSCSCWGCGNPRRHFGELTMQERRAEIDNGY